MTTIIRLNPDKIIDRVSTVYLHNRVRDLALSMANDGQVTPIMVEKLGNGQYKLVDGQMRLDAARQIKKNNPDFTIMAIVRESN